MDPPRLLTTCAGALLAITTVATAPIAAQSSSGATASTAQSATAAPAAPTQFAISTVDWRREGDRNRRERYGSFLLMQLQPCREPDCVLLLGNQKLPATSAAPTATEYLLDVGSHVLLSVMNGLTTTETITVQQGSRIVRLMDGPAKSAATPAGATGTGSISLDVNAPGRLVISGLSTAKLRLRADAKSGGIVEEREIDTVNGKAVELSGLLATAAATTSNDDPLWIDVRAGTFDMTVQPATKVNAFRVMATEVTWRHIDAWRRRTTTGITLPEWMTTAFPEDLMNHPAVNVSWTEARDFCGSIGARLPREYEWEWALRSGHLDRTYGFETGPLDTALPRQAATGTNVVPTGSQPGAPRRAGNFADETAAGSNPDWPIIKGYRDEFTHTAPVARFRPVNGVYDLAGNVWEWTEDAYSERAGSNADPTLRVARGGSFTSSLEEVKVSSRVALKRDERRSDLGFRCVR